jgi:hypothetical protein
MDKLLAEGYYTELQDLARPHAKLQNLAQQLMQANFSLRAYEDHRTQNRLSREAQQNLAAMLAGIAESLQTLRCVMSRNACPGKLRPLNL